MAFKKILFIFLAFSTCVFASQTNLKNYQSLKDFSGSKPKGITISNRGELSLAPVLKKIAGNSRPFLWDVEVDDKGNIYAATGDGALLLRVNSRGQIDTLFQDTEAEIFAIALDKKGDLYAAISPDARIFRIFPDGKKNLLVRLNEKYVWDLVFNEKNECFAATGDSGIIYKITTSGKANEFYRTGDLHARSLAFDEQGNLLVGTSNKGYIYRIDAKGAGFVLFDSNYEEIRRIEISNNGTIYALAVSQKGAKKLKKELKDSKQKPVSIDGDFGTFSFSSDEMKQTITTAIISVNQEGFAQTFWQPPVGEVIYSLSIDKGNLLTGTGEKGRLYRINCSDKTAFTHFVQVDEPQISSISKTKKGEFILGTSNLLAFYRLKSRLVKEGSMESPVFDARFVSTWGEIQWEKAGEIDVQFFTRAGNTEKPNQTWSDWQKVARITSERARIVSPTARFLQWKVVLKRKESAGENNIHDIRISYQQKNFPPEITSLKVEPLAKRKTPTTKKSTSSLVVDFGELDDLYGGSAKSSMQSFGERSAKRNGYFKISWKAEDPNQDVLVYEIQIRHEKEKSFWSIKKDLKRKSFTWDSRTLPDGKYQIKLIASDRTNNPLNLAKKAERISNLFIVDHTPPEVRNIKLIKNKNQKLTLKFQIYDKMSTIREAYISLNAKEWQWVNPIDGVSDSPLENFEIQLEKPENQIHSIVIKALDERENIGYGRLSTEDLFND